MMNMVSRVLLCIGFTACVAQATEITISIENTSPTGGVSLTPFWVAAHNGGFDSYDGGQLASNFPGITELAEEGMTGPISMAFANSNAGMAGGVDATILAVSQPGDAPVLSPGESVSFGLNVGDSSINRYFSYASMVVPSNDLFVANGNPLAHMLFDANGLFTGPVIIEILGSAVNDNGTEVNNVFGGAAFSALGGVGEPENNPIRNLFTDPSDVDYLNSLLGTPTVVGTTITSVFGPQDVIARITITPEPTALALVGVGGLLAVSRRRNGARA